MSDVAVSVAVIGHARTLWRRREDAPHQPSASPAAAGTIELLPAYRAGLADLDSFARVWVIFLFDRSRGWAPRVKPPRGGRKRGVFATRAPNRPSQLGLTSALLDRIDHDAGVLHLRGLDLLDQTPVLDVKPYLPMIDAWPDAGHGWLEEFLAAGIEPRLKKPLRPMRGR